MKTIKYFLVNILVISVFTLLVSGMPEPKHLILIQPSDESLSLINLNKSAEIITKRLNYFSAGEFDISVIPETKQIRIEYTHNFDSEVLENLILGNGKIEFCETYSRNELVSMLNGDNQLFTLLTKSNSDRPDAIIGCTQSSETDRVDDYLKTIDNEQNIRFAWSESTDKPMACLYALKVKGGKGAIVSNNGIESAVYDQDRIKIRLTSDAATAFGEATKRNLGNVIAVLFDGRVISAPRVMSEMNSGEIEISGKFTETEGAYIAALLSTDVLPGSFYVVR